MKMMLKIVRTDMKALFTHFFVLVIALGLSVLPALYAWFNIYSNWDPYKRTGNIKIAIASKDQGYELENGDTVNASEEIVQEVVETDSVKWVETSAKKAKKGVESGKYYAAVIFTDEFTENMYTGFENGLERPKVIYYENQKKNAVATKITETAVDTLEKQIDQQYITIIVDRLFEIEQNFGGSVDSDSEADFEDAEEESYDDEDFEDAEEESYDEEEYDEEDDEDWEEDEDADDDEWEESEDVRKPDVSFDTLATDDKKIAAGGLGDLPKGFEVPAGDAEEDLDSDDGDALEDEETNDSDAQSDEELDLESGSEEDAEEDSETAVVNLAAQLKSKLEAIKKNVKSYKEVVDSLIAADEKLVGSIDVAEDDLASIESAISGAGDSGSGSFATNIINYKNQTSDCISQAVGFVQKAQDESEEGKKQEYYEKAAKQLKKAYSSMQSLSSALGRINVKNDRINTSVNYAKKTVDDQMKTLKKLHTTVGDLSDGTKKITQKAETDISQKLSSCMDLFNGAVIPFVNQLSAEVETVTNDISAASDSVASDIELLEEVLGGAQEAVSAADESYESLSDMLGNLIDKLDTLIAIIGNLSDTELFDTFLTFMQADADAYGEFFAAPVLMETKPVYPVDNYGSGVAPFYTALALWVGGIFLVSLIKVRPSRKKFPDAKDHELFLGRFVLFFLLGQLQTVIVVLGNLYLLHIQCERPIYYWIVCAVTSAVFMLLIYAFTVSFGDIGKAVVVVIVVLQIAGSSGTYPIEILPKFYQSVYKFFPFPYAIDAMRETICGLYEQDIVIYMVKLLAFAVFALLLGLVVRLPFKDLNHFVEKRMEDTGFM